FVSPLWLAIPVANRLGGLLTAAMRFFGIGRAGMAARSRRPRGLMAVRIGLTCYDWLAGRNSLRTHQVSALGTGRKSDDVVVPDVDQKMFRWVCGYSDAQMLYPERFVLALLSDSKRAAPVTGAALVLRTWSRVSRNGSRFHIVDRAGHGETIQPSLVVNATGAWGDLTLASLNVEEQRLFAGTKGSHLFSRHAGLRERMRGAGIYAEAPDGRLVFILPCGAGTLIGTTDLPFAGRPETASADQDEVLYLLEMVNSVFESITLDVSDVEMRYAGVRPLPCVEASVTSAIPRGHAIHVTRQAELQILTLTGGKLTTCRALAQEVTDRVLAARGQPRSVQTHSRIVPGGCQWPQSETDVHRRKRELAEKYGLNDSQVSAVWQLVGNRFSEIFEVDSSGTPRPSLSGTSLPLEFVRWSILNEDCQTLEDLIERRLMLTFASGLTQATLRELAEELVHAGLLDGNAIESRIDEVVARLRDYHGISVN
ncbi:MAG: FAD-dependent oxidoreductase, partial [Planctomycetaceae bacterium]